MASRTRATGGRRAVVGVAHHGGWAILITVAGGKLVDRRRVELLEEGLPSFPHHHEGQALPLPEGVALVERVRASANRSAARCFDMLAQEVPEAIAGIALRRLLPIPDTVEECITNYRAQAVADSVMYRDALAQAAQARGWFVELFDAKTVLTESVRGVIERTGKSMGPPWQKDHRVAMAAALAAAARI